MSGAAVDLTGAVIGQVEVLRPERATCRGGKDGRRWLCRCSCGNEYVKRGSHLLESMRAGNDLCCRTCRGAKLRGVTTEGRFCVACFGMPWRRPVKKPCACGESHAPEPEVTLYDLQPSASLTSGGLVFPDTDCL